MNLIHNGDCRSVLKQYPDNHFDCLISDPPYGLGDIKDIAALIAAWLNDTPHDHLVSGGFMSEKWDRSVPPPAVWREVFRVLKPGATGFVFAGTRTQDLMALSLRLAGFEIEDTLMWIFGSHFVKGAHIGKHIDKELGLTRQVIGIDEDWIYRTGNNKTNSLTYTDDSFGRVVPNGGKITAPASEAAAKWEGYYSQMKSLYEPILRVRKPNDGTFAQNALKWGVAGLNIADCGLGGSWDRTCEKDAEPRKWWDGFGMKSQPEKGNRDFGRFPSNVLFAHDPACTDTCAPGCPVAELDQQRGVYGHHDDTGGASRFFYCHKASPKERNHGLEHLPEIDAGTYAQDEWSRQNMGQTPDAQRAKVRNFHVTVKPLAVMRWLCRLAKMPDCRLVLDPFAGSGTTGVAAIAEGMQYVLIEQAEKYMPLIEGRIAQAQKDYHGATTPPPDGNYPPAPDTAPTRPAAPPNNAQISLL